MTTQLAQSIVKDFRQDLEGFYRQLQLAPPYDSVEKALNYLSNLVKTKTPDEQQQIVQDQAQKWRLYQEAIIQSGLNRKHRGIITGILRSQQLTDFPEAQRYIREPFLNQQS